MVASLIRGLFQDPILTKLELGVATSPKYQFNIAQSRGFTLIELLIVVAIIGLLAAVGVPVYNGYVDSAKTTAAQNGLRSIYLMELDYYSENNRYYDTGSTCDNQTTKINENLFSGFNTLDDSHFYYCIKPEGSGYKAYAQEKSGSRSYSIDDNNSLTN